MAGNSTLCGHGNKWSDGCVILVPVCLGLVRLWLLTLLLGRDLGIWDYNSSQEMSGSYRTSTNFLWQQEELQIQFSRVSPTRFSLSFVSYSQNACMQFLPLLLQSFELDHILSVLIACVRHSKLPAKFFPCTLSTQLSSQAWIYTPPSPL